MVQVNKKNQQDLLQPINPNHCCKRNCIDWYEIRALTDHEFYYINIAKGTTDPGVDYFNQLLWFGLVKLV